MTTRITVAILLVTWTIIVVGDSAAYFTARETLLTLLDDSLVARATPLLDHSVNPNAPVNSLVPQGDVYEIRDASNRVLQTFAGSAGLDSEPLLVNKTFEYRADGKRYRTVAVSALAREKRDGASQVTTVVYSRPAESFDKLTNYIIAVLSSIGAFCGLATGWVALKVSRAALRPLTETAEVIAAIDEKNLSQRIPSHKLPPELVPMTNRLNELLERLERVFSQRKQFLADAAHELRTPTAALLTTLEVALRRRRDQKALEEAMGSALNDARLLRRLVDKLMEQARSDHMLVRPRLEELDLAKLLRDSIDTVTSMAGEKDVTIDAQFPATLPFTTQRDRLQSIILNLLTNGIEYNHRGGKIEIVCAPTANGIQLSVRDSGTGISAEHLPHIFEPFYRADREKQGDTEHLGLGLFLVQSHIQALRGECIIKSERGEGTTVTVNLPAIAPTPSHLPQPTAQPAVAG
jgi:two-component system heavy metal sensor histidine kinase CusS